MNGSMMNQKNYLHVLLHYSVILHMQVIMSLNYHQDQKQLLIFQVLLCHNQKKPVELKMNDFLMFIPIQNQF